MKAMNLISFPNRRAVILKGSFPHASPRGARALRRRQREGGRESEIFPPSLEVGRGRSLVRSLFHRGSLPLRHSVFRPSVSVFPSAGKPDLYTSPDGRTEGATAEADRGGRKKITLLLLHVTPLGNIRLGTVSK